MIKITYVKGAVVMTDVLSGGVEFARSSGIPEVCIQKCPNVLRLVNIMDSSEPAVSQFGQESLLALASLSQVRRCAPKKYVDRDAVNDEHLCTAVNLGIRN